MVQAPKRVILLNGPPSSGKDLSAIIIRNFLLGKVPIGGIHHFNPVVMKFADPLKAAAHQLLAIPFSCEHYEKEFGNDWKNKPQVEFFGKTPRSEYIALSETYAKERHGSDVFGRIAARRISLSKSDHTFIFSDSGFAEEAAPVIGLVGLSNVVLIELERTGCSYDGDSRSYIGGELSLQFPGLNKIRIPNNDNQMMLTALLKGVMAKYFKYQAEF